MYYLMSSGPILPPFSDWCAQVERYVNRSNAIAEQVTLDRSNAQLRACYDVGLSAREVADDWLANR
jgi:hypothetical protein